MQYSLEFLRELYGQKNLKKYAKVTALTLEEFPIESIEGAITQGSINIDGSSAVRRTCSLTMVTEQFKYDSYDWALKTKFKLEIGLENHINTNYPDIIWFKQGIYLLTSFNTSHSTNNFTISLSGKDKMALLNGEIGGSIESSVDFGTIEEEDADGNWIIRKLPLKEIIRNAIHVYAHEPYHKIIIKDLDSYGLELLEYKYDEPLYLIRKNNQNNYFNAYFDMPCEYLPTEGGSRQANNLSQIPEDQFEILLDNSTNDNNGAQFYFMNNYTTSYRVAKIAYGDCAGYRLTDLVYAGDLVAKAGESITSMLDKIRNMLVEFEYFYDVDGFFIFQKKPSFTSALWSFPLSEDDAQSLPKKPEYAYEFYGQDLFTSLSYTPNILNLRNDYSIWGERTTVSGTKLPIHLRYAIDKMPEQYNTIEVADDEVEEYNLKYNVTLSGQNSTKYTIDDYDWREIIYRMAIDYYKYNHLDNFESKVAIANPEYPTGKTGYEQYYTDLQGFWRQIYNADISLDIYAKEQEITVAKMDQATIQNMIKEAQLTVNEFNIIKTSYEKEIAEVLEYEQTVAQLEASMATQEQQLAKLSDDIKNTTIDEATTKYLEGRYTAVSTEYEEHKTLLSQLRLQAPDSSAEDLLTDLYNAQLEALKASDSLNDLENSLRDIEIKISNLTEDLIELQETYYPAGHSRQYWCRIMYEQPDALNFWFDFLNPSTDSELTNYSVKSIGARPKVVNDSNVKSIYYREVPNVIYSSSLLPDTYGYKMIQIPTMDNMFSISAQGKSAKMRLDELVYQHFYCAESANITSIPLYHLQPNSRILLNDTETKLCGDYAVSKITIPLAYNGTMSITATKINN